MKRGLREKSESWVGLHLGQETSRWDIEQRCNRGRDLGEGEKIGEGGGGGGGELQ